MAREADTLIEISFIHDNCKFLDLDTQINEGEHSCICKFTQKTVKSEQLIDNILLFCSLNHKRRSWTIVLWRFCCVAAALTVTTCIVIVSV